MEKAKDLEKSQKGLQKKMLSTIVGKQLGENYNRFRLNGYLCDLRVNYNKDEFEFMPGEFIVDEKGILWICLGAGRAPDFGSGEVLWFLSEKEDVNFFDNFYLQDFTRSFAKVPSLVT